MPIEHNYGGWRACLWKSNQRVRGPVRETLEKAAKDLTHLQEVHQESLAAPQARATAVTAEAISSKSSEEKLHQTLVDTMSQWLRQGHRNSLSRATPESKRCREEHSSHLLTHSHLLAHSLTHSLAYSLTHSLVFTYTLFAKR